MSLDTFADQFNFDWYVLIKVVLNDTAASGKGKSIGIEDRISQLEGGLRSRLNPHQIELWPQKLKDARNTDAFTNYWVIGLPTIDSAMLASSRQFVREWQDEVNNKTTPKVIVAKFISRKVFLEHDFQVDSTDVATGLEIDHGTQIRTGDGFKKKAGSNPQQVRQQFFHHAMGHNNETEGRKASAKLRPVKQVLNRLRHDAEYVSSDYVIGFIDRQAGIIEKPVDEWGDFEQEDLVAYFKYLPDDQIVWDRVRKIDLIFK